jgi:hypothetical protein
MNTSVRAVLMFLGCLFAVAPGLGGCRRSGVFAGGDHQGGRYSGVGIYVPNVTWTKMVEDERPKSEATATLADDEAIIVVTDSQTGEVRACGDLSGHCVSMNPWQAGLAKSQVTPIDLTQHGNPTGGGAANTAVEDVNAAASDANAAVAPR